MELGALMIGRLSSDEPQAARRAKVRFPPLAGARYVR